MSTLAKLRDFNYEMLPHPPCFPYLPLRKYYLFADIKTKILRKRFGPKDDVITSTQAYFESLEKSLYKKCDKMLQKRYTGFNAHEHSRI